MTPLKFSIVIPVFNRPKEICELLESLSKQTYKQFEVIVVDDGSYSNMKPDLTDFGQRLELQYFDKPNTGPGDSRNFGATKANGDYLIFFDSDCLVPDNYLSLVAQYLSKNPLDVYGGPDKAHESFTNLQKAIDYSMTSFLTTGGIRGHQKAAVSFQPRSFNMGISRSAWVTSEGFSDIHPGEDPDLIYRLVKKGHSKGLIPQAHVYHKRRVNFTEFSRQVYRFGVARSILMKWHEESRRWIFALPTLALICGISCLILGFWNPVFWYPILLGLTVVLIDSLRYTRNLIAGFLGLIATIVQVSGYGWGFFKGWWYLFIIRKQERSKFASMFRSPVGNFPDSNANIEQIY